MLKEMLIKGGLMVGAIVVANTIIEKFEKQALEKDEEAKTLDEVESRIEEINKEWDKLIQKVNAKINELEALKQV